MPEETIEFLKGKVVTSIERVGDEKLIFNLQDGTVCEMLHDQNCCESVTIDDICGSLDDLIGIPILQAEEVTHENETPEGVIDPSVYAPESYTWTFYKLATIKGYVTIRWYGASNGYYSESVSFYVLR